MGSIARTLRQLTRKLSRSPGFTVVSVVTLALGIGATTTVFSLVDSLLLRSLPVPDPARLVTLHGSPIADLFRQRDPAADSFRDKVA